MDAVEPTGEVIYARYTAVFTMGPCMRIATTPREFRQKTLNMQQQMRRRLRPSICTRTYKYNVRL